MAEPMMTHIISLIKDASFECESCSSNGLHWTSSEENESSNRSAELSCLTFSQLSLGRTSIPTTAGIDTFVAVQEAIQEPSRQTKKCIIVWANHNTLLKQLAVYVEVTQDFHAILKEHLISFDVQIKGTVRRLGLAGPTCQSTSGFAENWLTRGLKSFEFKGFLQQASTCRGCCEGHNTTTAILFSEPDTSNIAKAVLQESSSRIRLKLKFNWSVSVRWTPQLPVVTTAVVSKSNDILFDGAIMDGNESTDMVLVVGHRAAERHCHKFMLGGQSPVFYGMLRSGLEESKSSRIHIHDLSEEGADVLLPYLYGMPLNVEDLSCEIAVELFQAAHKYELGHSLMERGLACHFLRMRADSCYFTADVALELYFFVRNLDEYRTLQKHLLKIMTEMTDAIKVCERYKDLEVDEQLDLLWSFLYFVTKTLPIPPPPPPA